MRPDLAREGSIAGQPRVFGDEVDELAVTVVFIDRIGASLVDAAGDLAAGELVGREPADVVADVVVEAEAEQHRRRQRAVADPASPVVARAAANGRTVAAEEGVGDGGACGVDEIARGRNVDLDVVDDPAPVRDGYRALVGLVARNRLRIVRMER